MAAADQGGVEAVSAIHTMVWYALPAGWRQLTDLGMFSVELWQIQYNATYGLSLRLPCF